MPCLQELIANGPDSVLDCLWNKTKPNIILLNKGCIETYIFTVFIHLMQPLRQQHNCEAIFDCNKMGWLFVYNSNRFQLILRILCCSKYRELSPKGTRALCVVRSNNFIIEFNLRGSLQTWQTKTKTSPFNTHYTYGWGLYIHVREIQFSQATAISPCLTMESFNTEGTVCNINTTYH